MHLAIIMNGNGEWANRHGLAPTASHAAGVSALRNTVAVAVETGIKTLTLYAICTPGYGRPSEEINADLSVSAVMFEPTPTRAASSLYA